jgi:glutathione S-transferase
MKPIRLYDSAISGNCYKVRLLLSHLGMPYERVEVSVAAREKRREVLGHMNPAAKIPILEFDDERFMAESNAILWYLAQKTIYLFDDPFLQARVLGWMFFEQNNLEANIATSRWWLTVKQVGDDYKEHLELRHEAGHQALATLEGHLVDREFLVDNHYSIADISLYAYTHVAPEGGFSLADYPSVRDWIKRIQQQPGYVPMVEKE